MIKLKSLIENADTLEVLTRDSYVSPYARSFFYFVTTKVAVVSKTPEIHSQLLKNPIVMRQFELNGLDIKEYMREFERGNMAWGVIEGRMWYNIKAMSLWYYPFKDQFFEMINALEKEYQRPMDDWSIEVFKYVESDTIEKGSFDTKIYPDLKRKMIEPFAIKIKNYK